MGFLLYPSLWSLWPLLGQSNQVRQFQDFLWPGLHMEHAHIYFLMGVVLVLDHDGREKPKTSLSSSMQSRRRGWTWFSLPNRGDGLTTSDPKPRSSYHRDTSSELQLRNPQGQSEGDRTECPGQGLPVSLTALPGKSLPQEPYLAPHWFKAVPLQAGGSYLGQQRCRALSCSGC